MNLGSILTLSEGRQRNSVLQLYFNQGDNDLPGLIA